MKRLAYPGRIGNHLPRAAGESCLQLVVANIEEPKGQQSVHGISDDLEGVCTYITDHLPRTMTSCHSYEV